MTGVGLPGGYSLCKVCEDGGGVAKTSSEYIELSYVGVDTEKMMWRLNLLGGGCCYPLPNYDVV